MEIVIILLLIGVVSFVVYFQLKGSRPDVVPVQHLGVGKKAVKKAPVQKTAVTEKWDELEVSPKTKKNKSTDESPKKKKKERFDPVAEGKKVLKSETLKKRETAKLDEEKTEEEKVQEKRTRSRLAADGFVVIDEKKPKAKKVAAVEEAPVEKVVEEAAPLSEFELRLQKLRDVVSGSRPARKTEDGEVKTTGYQGKRDIKPVQEETAEEGEKKTVSKDKAIREHLQQIRAQNNNGKFQATSKPGEKRFDISASTVSAPSSGKRGWEKVQPKKEAAPAPVEEEAEEAPAAEEEAAQAPADEWAQPENVETEEF